MKKGNENSNTRHEGYMIPILHHFEGEVKSNDQGELIYIFPNMKTTSIVIDSQKQLELQYQAHQNQPQHEILEEDGDEEQERILALKVIRLLLVLHINYLKPSILSFLGPFLYYYCTIILSREKRFLLHFTRNIGPSLRLPLPKSNSLWAWAYLT